MKAKTKDLADVIRRRLAADSALADDVENERLSADVAHAIWAARNETGLTQGELADHVGTHQSAIARLEDSEYDGHSLSMLKRIAKALGKRVSVQFLPASSEKADRKQTTKVMVVRGPSMTRKTKRRR